MIDCSACDVRIIEWIFFVKQKTAYEMRISDWSSDVCSSDLHGVRRGVQGGGGAADRRRLPEHRAAGAAAGERRADDRLAGALRAGRDGLQQSDRKSVV